MSTQVSICHPVKYSRVMGL